MKTLTFTNKSEYLAWRSIWRAEYAALSNEIREHKQARKNERGEAQSHAQGMCFIRRQQAAAMLVIRAKSKIRAQEQYAAAKAQPASA